jgi:hypothetical protein
MPWPFVLVNPWRERAERDVVSNRWRSREPDSISLVLVGVALLVRALSAQSRVAWDDPQIAIYQGREDLTTFLDPVMLNHSRWERGS